MLNNLGPHGLPLIGRADWNDCLNLNCFSETPDESFQTTGNRTGRTAESVFIAGMFVGIAPDYAYLAEKRASPTRPRRRAPRPTKMTDVVLKHGWDGEWFLRAYDFFGKKVGSKENKEAQIFIEPQGFCVMAGIGVEGGQAKKALDSVKERLDTQVRHRAATTRPTREYHVELGEISSYPPGYKENAGIFCHNNPWVIIAETVIGRGDRAFEYWKKIAPAYLEEHERGPPPRAVRLRADDRGQGRRPSRRGQELLADRHGGVELRRHLAATCSACAPTTTGCASTPAWAARSASSP